MTHQNRVWLNLHAYIYVQFAVDDHYQLTRLSYAVYRHVHVRARFRTFMHRKMKILSHQASCKVVRPESGCGSNFTTKI